MTRRLLLALPLAAEQAIDRCELEAVGAWNRFSETSARYLKLRQAGIRSLKERQRMEEQFREVIKDPCF